MADEEGNSITVINAATNKLITTLNGMEGPHNLQVAPDGRTVWAVSGHYATRTLLGKESVGGGPTQVFVTPDNKYVLVANQRTKENPSTTVSIVDAATFTVVSTIETGKGPHGVVIDPSGRYAYIKNIYENTGSVIDIEQKTVIAPIPGGTAPNGISFSALPAIPASSSEAQLEIPESDMMDMPGMTP